MSEKNNKSKIIKEGKTENSQKITKDFERILKKGKTESPRAIIIKKDNNKGE